MTTNPPDMKVRLSAELRRKVEEAARLNNRTLNAEIVSRLERSFLEVSGETTEQRIRNLEQNYVSQKEFAAFMEYVDLGFVRK